MRLAKTPQTQLKDPKITANRQIIQKHPLEIKTRKIRTPPIATKT
jgi:hypothetical protein